MFVVQRLSYFSPGEFYRRFRNDPEAARRVAFQIGQEMGQALKQRYHVQGEGLQGLVELIYAFGRSSHAGVPGIVSDSASVEIEGEKLVMRNSGFCAVMRAALTLNIPWEWLDTNLAWPALEGMASVIRPDIKMRVSSARCRGDAACTHIFEIREVK